MTRISSKRMGKAVKLDPQLVLPGYPHFPHSFQLIPISNGVIIHGGEKLQFFQGKKAYSFLTLLQSLLDGTNSLDDIYRKLPQINRETLFNNLALLYSRGLLEDGLGDQGIDVNNINSKILNFFRRHTDSTRVNRSAAEGINRMLSEKITIFGNTNYTKQLQLNFKLLDIHNISLQTKYDFELDDKTFVIVLLKDLINHDDLKRIDNLCASKGIPWLLSFFVNGTTGIIGPYFKRGETACYECFLDLYKNQSFTNQYKTSNPFLFDMWVELTTMEVTHLLSRLLPHQTGSNFNIFSLTNWSKKTRRVPRRPGCKHCQQINGFPPKTPEIAMQYETEVNWPSKNLNIPKGHQIHYSANVKNLTYEAKEYPNLKSVKLPPSDELPTMTKQYLPSIFTDSRTSTLPTKNKLARILLSGGGFRNNPTEAMQNNEKIQRFSPTGGNLGSVQMYIIANDISGLQKDVYYYQPLEHSIQSLATLSDIDNVNDVLKQIIGTSYESQPKGMIIMTGAYKRLVSKYGAFGYRVIYMDTGAAIASLQGAALSMGIKLQHLTQYNEQPITDLLRLDFNQEPITGVLIIK